MTDFPPPGGYQPQDPRYPQQVAGYPPPRQQVRPGRSWYTLPLAIAAAGITWLIIGILSLVSTVSHLQRVTLPGGGTVNLAHSGGYTIYYEGPGAQSGNIPSFHVHITPVSSGAAASSLNQYGSGATYNIGSHQGRAVLTLNVASPGKFAVTATGGPVTGADLAFGGSIASSVVRAFLPALPLIILGSLGALTLLIVRIARTRSLQRGYA